MPFDENAPQFSLLNSNIIKLYLGVNKVGFPTWHYRRCMRYCDDKLTDLCIKNIYMWNDNIENVLLEYKQNNKLFYTITSNI